METTDTQLSQVDITLMEHFPEFYESRIKGKSETQKQEAYAGLMRFIEYIESKQ